MAKRRLRQATREKVAEAAAKAKTKTAAVGTRTRAPATKRQKKVSEATQKAAETVAKKGAAAKKATKKGADRAKQAPASVVARGSAAAGTVRDKTTADLRAMQATVAVLGNRLGDRKLVATVDATLDLTVERLREAVVFARSTAEEAREGFDDFDVGAFRRRLRSLLTSLLKAGAQARRILVETDPNEPLFRGKAAERLIGKTPPVMLYAVHRAMEPLGDDFWQLPSEVAVQLKKLPTLQETLGEQRARACSELLKVPEVEIVLRVQLLRLGFATSVLEFAKANLPNDLTGTAVAVGGGGMTLTKYPPTWVIDVILKIVEFEEKAIQRILEVWAQCERLKAEEAAQEAQRRAQEQIDRIELKLDRLLAARAS